MLPLKLNTRNHWLIVFSLGVPLNFYENDLYSSQSGFEIHDFRSTIPLWIVTAHKGAVLRNQILKPLCD